MKVKIFQQHTHEGVTYPAGSEVDLPEDVARWLIQVGAEQRREIVVSAMNTEKIIAGLEAARPQLKAALEARE